MAQLVIGVGNPDRGDDAAGVMVVRGLVGARTKEVSDCAGLIDIWDGEEEVVVIDAMRSGSPPGTVVRFDALGATLPARTFPSTHSFGLAEAIELGRALGRLPESLVVYGIEVSEFNHGRRLTSAVRDAVDDVVRVIERGG